jgi:hypothetical protein
MCLIDQAYSLYAIHPRKVNIHEDDIRFGRFNFVHQVRTIRKSTGACKAIRGVYKLDQAVTQQRVIFKKWRL